MIAPHTEESKRRIALSQSETYPGFSLSIGALRRNGYTHYCQLCGRVAKSVDGIRRKCRAAKHRVVAI